MKTTSKTTLLDKVPPTLLLQYLMLIKQIEIVKGISIQRYGELDFQRGLVHEDILSHAGTNRDDEDFQYDLALFCENAYNL